MEKEYSDSRTVVAASCPPWVMLKSLGCKRDSIVAETQAAAAALTSTNLIFHVSLLRAAPPASSRLYYDLSDSTSCLDDGEAKKFDELRVIAVHGDAVLLRVRNRADVATTELKFDFFLYETGTGQARPPSLLLLPRCYFPRHYDQDRFMPWPDACALYTGETCLLRCGQEELLVAHLELSRWYFPTHYDKEKPSWDTAEICVLRVGQLWELKQEVPIVFDDHQGSKGDVVMRRWEPDAAIGVGDRYLCWVDYILGMLFCDMSRDDASLKLRYVAMPVLPEMSYLDGRHNMLSSRDFGGAGTSAVRFVHVKTRTVTTWTLSLSMDDPLEWVKNCVLHLDDILALPVYKGLPQVIVELPIMSLDNADMIWLMVNERDYANLSYRRAWMIEVDTRSKALLSVVPYNEALQLESDVAVKLRC